MRDREERDDLDLQLDAALATYAAPEANPHLAAQILAAIAPDRTAAQARPTVPRRRWQPWAIAIPSIAIPALAAMLLAVFLPLRRSHQHHPLSPTAATPHITSSMVLTPPHPVAASHPPQTPAQTPTKTRRAQIQPSPVEASLPKQEVFPTPTPLTPQEQALAALTNRNPGDISQSVARAEQQPVEPIRIAAISIQPLNPPGKGEN
jgi:hypothetical protein